MSDAVSGAEAGRRPPSEERRRCRPKAPPAPADRRALQHPLPSFLPHLPLASLCHCNCCCLALPGQPAAAAALEPRPPHPRLLPHVCRRRRLYEGAFWLGVPLLLGVAIGCAIPTSDRCPVVPNPVARLSSIIGWVSPAATAAPTVGLPVRTGGTGAAVRRVPAGSASSTTCLGLPSCVFGAACCVLCVFRRAGVTGRASDGGSCGQVLPPAPWRLQIPGRRRR